MIKDAVPPSQQNNVEWLRKQHQMRKQMSSSPSPPHSSTSSSPEFQSRTVEGWQVIAIYVMQTLVIDQIYYDNNSTQETLAV